VHLCVCACVHACLRCRMCMCLCVNVSVGLWVCVSTCLYVCVSASVPVCMYVCVFVCECVSTCARACVWQLAVKDYDSQVDIVTDQIEPSPEVRFKYVFIPHDVDEPMEEVYMCACLHVYLCLVCVRFHVRYKKLIRSHYVYIWYACMCICSEIITTQANIYM